MLSTQFVLKLCYYWWWLHQDQQEIYNQVEPFFIYACFFFHKEKKTDFLF